MPVAHNSLIPDVHISGLASDIRGHRQWQYLIPMPNCVNIIQEITKKKKKNSKPPNLSLVAVWIQRPTTGWLMQPNQCVPCMYGKPDRGGRKLNKKQKDPRMGHSQASAPMSGDSTYYPRRRYNCWPIRRASVPSSMKVSLNQGCCNACLAVMRFFGS